MDNLNRRIGSLSPEQIKKLEMQLKERGVDIHQYLKNRNQSPLPSIEAAGEREYYPASSAQKRMYIINKLEKSKVSYNIAETVMLEGSLDRERLEWAFREMIKRHEPLRTSFRLMDREPVQVVSKDADFHLEYAVCREDELASRLEAFIRPFDLEQAPLLRGGLFKLDRDRHLLIYDMHHIISDGTSMGIFIRELAALYNRRELPPLKIQYKEFSLWQNSLYKSGRMEEQEKYWLDRLSGEIPVLDLLADYTRQPVQSFEGDNIYFEADGELTRKINKIRSETGATLYMVLLAAYNILLHRYTGQEDIIVGSPIAGRLHPDLENVMGMFINILPMRNYPRGDKTFGEFLEEVKKSSLDGFENQSYLFEELVGRMELRRDMSRNPLFDTVLILQNMSMPRLDLGELKLTPYRLKNKVSKYDLTLNCVEHPESIFFNLEYCTRLYSRETAERLSAHFINILKQAVENPGNSISSIDMLSEEERRQMIYGFNNTRTEYPGEKTIHGLFKLQARKTPESTALVFKDKKLTYRELNSRANRLAGVLREKGVGPGSIAGIKVTRSMEMITGILGILKAGGAYLPIDPEYPGDRIRYMLEDSGAALLLENREQETEYRGIRAVRVDDERIYSGEGTDIENVNMPSDLAYVIYTSGSTGRPKGAMIEHRAVHNFINGMAERISFSPGNTILALTTISFDIFLLETLLPLTRGMRVVIADESIQRDTGLLSEAIIKNGVNMLQMTSSRLKLLLNDAAGLSCLEGLESVMIGGEALPETLFRQLRRTTPGRIYNMYGPTETTVWSAIKDLTEAEEVNIGRPIANTEIYILDKYNCLQPAGIAGELCIAGKGLARGYLNRPELTEEKFVPHPFVAGERMYKTGDMARWLKNGEIEFLGRADCQVKIRGYRIEPGEIEECLLALDGVKECVVLSREDRQGNGILAAYYVSERDVTVGEFMSSLGKNLPDYMVPGLYIRLDRLPLTPNGKIDRKALPEPDNKRPTLENSYIEPEDGIEAEIAGVWKSILGVELVGVKDNFFELGGNSLLLVMMHGEIEKRFPGKIDVTDIFAYPTIMKMAQFIRDRQGDSGRDIPVKPLVLPGEFAAAGDGGGESAVLKFWVDSSTAGALEGASSENGVEISDVLLSLYLYLLNEVTGQDTVQVQAAAEGNGTVLPVDADFSLVTDLTALFRHTRHKRKGKSEDSYAIQDFIRAASRREDTSVIPFFCWERGLPAECLEACGIALIASRQGEGMDISFEYDAARLEKSRVGELVSSYARLIRNLARAYRET